MEETATNGSATSTDTRAAIVRKDIKHGRVRAEIERREGEGGIFYSTRLFRWYKSGEGEQDFERAYTFATSGRGDDLGDLMTAASEARNWILAQADYEAPTKDRPA